MYSRSEFINRYTSDQAKNKLKSKGHYGVAHGDNRDKYNCGSQSSGYSVLPSRREWEQAKLAAYRAYLDECRANYEKRLREEGQSSERE